VHEELPKMIRFQETVARMGYFITIRSILAMNSSYLCRNFPGCIKN